MNLGFWAISFCLSAAALTLSAPPARSAETGAKQPGASKELSEAPASNAATNVSLADKKRDGLRTLEESLYKPLQNLTPKSSLDGIFVPPARPTTGPAVQNKRLKEKLEKRKDWVFMSPEDLGSGPSTEEIFDMPEYERDGQKKKKLSPVERFYQKMDRERKGRSADGKLKDDDGRDQESTDS